MSNRSQQQAARALADATPGLKYTTALRQVQGKQSLKESAVAHFDFGCVDANPGRIAFATAPDGETVFSDPQEHLLVTGSTGSGRSVAAQALMYGFAASGAEMYVVNSNRGLDLKFVEPYAKGFADNIKDTLMVMEYVYAEIGRRHAILAHHGALTISGLSETVRPAPLVIMVDEFASLFTNYPVIDEDTAAEALARQQIIALTGRIARESRTVGVTLVIDAQRVGAAADGLKKYTSNLMLGQQAQRNRDAALRNSRAADTVPQGAPTGSGIWETQDRSGAAVQVWFATQERFTVELAKRRSPLPRPDNSAISAEIKAKLSKKLLADQSPAFLERLFAHNNRTNKSLVNEHGRTRPTPSPVQPFLQLGDIVSFYAGAKHQWTVANQSENFTILTDEDDGKAIYTIIDWRNGWRGPHSSWGFGTTTEEKRVVALAALESEELELSIRNALYLDIKTVRRNGTLTIRQAKRTASLAPLHLGTRKDGTPVVLGIPGHLVVTGYAGSGKTMLLERLATEAEATGMEVLMICGDEHKGAELDRAVLTDSAQIERALAGLHDRLATDPGLLLIVDEAAMLSVDHPELAQAVIDLVRIGRALGVQVVVSKQQFSYADASMPAGFLRNNASWLDFTPHGTLRGWKPSVRAEKGEAMFQPFDGPGSLIRVHPERSSVIGAGDSSKAVRAGLQQGRELGHPSAIRDHFHASHLNAIQGRTYSLTQKHPDGTELAIGTITAIAPFMDQWEVDNARSVCGTDSAGFDSIFGAPISEMTIKEVSSDAEHHRIDGTTGTQKDIDYLTSLQERTAESVSLVVRISSVETLVEKFPEAATLIAELARTSRSRNIRVLVS